MPIPAVNRAPKAPEEGELRLLQGDLYMVVRGNVYEYDALDEKKGKYVGRLKADDSIDTTAAEQAGGRRRSRKQRKSKKSKKQRKTKGYKMRRSQ